MIYGFGLPPFSSANLASHHFWRKTLITIAWLVLSLVWHRSNGWDAAHPTVVCYLATKLSRSAAPNGKSVAEMFVGKLFERQRVFADISA
jgi:hypothetical protein